MTELVRVATRELRGSVVGRSCWASIALGWPCGTICGVPTLTIAQDPAADELLGRDPLALLIGMLLDQHMRQRSRGMPRG
jgi:hypothetical protein